MSAFDYDAWQARQARQAAWAERVAAVRAAGPPWGEWAAFTAIGDGPNEYIAGRLLDAGFDPADELVDALADEVMFEALDVADRLVAEVAAFARLLHAIDWSPLAPPANRG